MPYCEELYKYKIVVSRSLNNATPLTEYLASSSLGTMMPSARKGPSHPRRGLRASGNAGAVHSILKRRFI